MRRLFPRSSGPRAPLKGGTEALYWIEQTSGTVVRMFLRESHHRHAVFVAQP